MRLELVVNFHLNLHKSTHVCHCLLPLSCLRYLACGRRTCRCGFVPEPKAGSIHSNDERRTRRVSRRAWRTAAADEVRSMICLSVNDGPPLSTRYAPRIFAHDRRTTGRSGTGFVLLHSVTCPIEPIHRNHVRMGEAKLQ